MINFEGKQVELYRVYNKKKRLEQMQYNVIDGVEYGFYYNFEDDCYYAVNLEYGLSAAATESEGRTEKEAFKILREKIEKLKELPADKYEKAFVEAREKLTEFGLKLPINK